MRGSGKSGLGKTRLLVVLAAACMGVALVSACGSDSDTGAPISVTGAQINEQPRDNLREGGSLTTALVEVSPQWNTFQADGTAYTQLLWRWYNPNLAYFSPDGEYRPNTDFVTKVDKTLVDGNTVVTYTLNPKASYNDGTPFDYRSFVTTWQANSGRDARYVTSSTDGYDKIDSVTRGVDDRQVVVRFKGVYAWPDGLFNNVLHPKVANPDFYNKAYLQQPHPELGAGPYTIASYDRNQGTVVFQRNPKWWGNPGKLDQRVFRQMESQASINAFRNGEIDATGVGTKDRLAQVKSMSGIDIRTSATPAQSLMVINTDSPILADVRVREAIMRGTDRATLAKIEFNGLNYSEPLPGSLLLYSFEKGYEDNLSGVVDFNADQAKQLLDQAGWTVGGDGTRTKDGQRLTLTLPTLGDDPTGQAQVRALQAMYKTIGVDLNVIQRPSSDFSKVVTNKEFDIFLMGFQSSDPFGMAYFCQIWCEKSSFNKSGAGSPQLDAEIARVGQIADPAEQIAAGNKVERTAFAQYAMLPFTNGPTMVAVKQGLANYGAGQFFVGPVEDIGWQK
ncbi:MULTISPECIES: ABC transporter substrate-binding protein [unclassified Gordonia (in: high G+C Gram-positive bacteria)]|uniref:ABC transporter family substrate-binding protein n=1 Tax=Gordonia sp. B7-2 TaxID=3420932 RepID=UPI003D930CA0